MDLGLPGPLISFVESCAGYEELLLAFIQRESRAYSLCMETDSQYRDRAAWR